MWISFPIKKLDQIRSVVKPKMFHLYQYSTKQFKISENQVHLNTHEIVQEIRLLPPLLLFLLVKEAEVQLHYRNPLLQLLKVFFFLKISVIKYQLYSLSFFLFLFLFYFTLSRLANDKLQMKNAEPEKIDRKSVV